MSILHNISYFSKYILRLAWVLMYVTSLFGMSCLWVACVFPGPTFQRPVSRSVETALIRRPKAGSSCCELVACRETWPCVVEPAKVNSGFNAPRCSRNCSLFVRLPSPETGRPRLPGRSRNAIVGMHIEGHPVAITPRWGLRLQLPNP